MRTRKSSFLALIATVTLVAPVIGEDKPETKNSGSEKAVKTAPAKASGSQEGPKVEVASTFRASDLLEMDVRNRQNKDIGSIDDIVVDLKSGKIRYAALSFGGFAGFNDKLFAVPWKAIQFKFDEDDRYLVIDVSEEKLEKARGFDEDNWPNVGDPRWAAQVEQDFKSAESAAKENKENAENTDTKDAGTKAEGENIVYATVYRGSSLKGMEVKNREGKDLGTIDELVFDLREGRVAYAALSYGGVLGVGDKLFAVPFEAFTVVHEPDDKYLVLNVSEQKLEAGRGFDKDKWPDTADPKWAEDLDKHYEISRERKKTSTKVESRRE